MKLGTLASGVVVLVARSNQSNDSRQPGYSKLPTAVMLPVPAASRLGIVDQLLDVAMVGTPPRRSYVLRLIRL